MKKITIVLLMFFILQVQTFAVVIPENTVITVKPSKMIDADDVKEGDTVHFQTLYPVKVKGEVIIKAGTDVSAKITKKKNNNILGIPGEIEVGTFELHTPVNEIIPLSGSIENKGEGRYWANIGWLFLLPFIFVKGGDGKIPVSNSVNLYTLEAGNY